jgi:hypothetical protein
LFGKAANHSKMRKHEFGSVIRCDKRERNSLMEKCDFNDTNYYHNEMRSVYVWNTTEFS